MANESRETAPAVFSYSTRFKPAALGESEGKCREGICFLMRVIPDAPFKGSEEEEVARCSNEFMKKERWSGTSRNNKKEQERKRRASSMGCLFLRGVFHGTIACVKLNLLCTFINIPHVGNPLYFQRIGVVDSYEGGGKGRLLIERSLGIL